MRSYWHKETATIYHSDCLKVLAKIPENSVDTVITDPPYHLTQATRGGSPRKQGKGPVGRHRLGEKGFMGQTWDGGGIAFDPATWQAVLRVMKPGGFLLAMGGTRTWHRLACAIEDAGFEIRDSMMWIYAQGFAKGKNISKGIDKLLGVDRKKEREIADHLRARRKELGLSKAEVDRKVFGGTTRYAFVEGRDDPTGAGRIYLPTPGEWQRLKDVLKLDDRFDAYVNKAIPERRYRHRADGGKSRLVMEKEGDFGYQTDGERWDGTRQITEARTPEARFWDGWNVALKPAWEPILVAMKPRDGTFAENALKHGVSGLNIDAARIGTHKNTTRDGFDRYNKRLCEQGYRPNEYKRDGEPSSERRYLGSGGTDFDMKPGRRGGSVRGRWPANLILSHDERCVQIGLQKVKNPHGSISGREPGRPGVTCYGDFTKHPRTPFQRYGDADGMETTELWACVPGCSIRLMDDASGNRKTTWISKKHRNARTGEFLEALGHPGQQGFNDSGGASRFFYHAKVSTRERNLGMPKGEKNKHPTLKPVDLMRYLCVLTSTPTGGIVLDPFMGAGSTGIAAVLTGRPFIGIEKDKESCRTSRCRIKHAQKHPEDFADKQERKRAEKALKAKKAAADGWVQSTLFKQ